MHNNVNNLKQIRLEACNICQLKCPLCDTPNRNKNSGVLGSGYLKFKYFKKLIDENPTIKIIELSWLGEIFLNPDISQILRYAFKKGIALKANGGVNLNKISPETLRDLVKYRFTSITISIDGASQKTYVKYRKGGKFREVINNIMKINKYKREFQSNLPILYWQYIVFGHNEHEIPFARELAKKLGMSFYTKLSWDQSFSPIKDSAFVMKETGKDFISREEYASQHGKHYMNKVCKQLWEEPVINWNGDLFGCSKNDRMSFGNIFDSSLEAVLNSDKFIYMKEMIARKQPPRNDIICTKCPVFEKRESK